jgi:hypothetical protein
MAVLLFSAGPRGLGHSHGRFVASSKTSHSLDPHSSRSSSSLRCDCGLRRDSVRALVDLARKTKATLLRLLLLLAGPRGLEPRPLVLETRILPLNYRPKKCLGDIFC